MHINRWTITPGLLAILFLASVGVYALIPAAPGITKANLECVRIGMTRAEVETILGGAANGENTGLAVEG